MDITNKMLVEYFKQDEVLNKECPILKKYLRDRKKQFVKNGKNYLGLAELFMSDPASDETKPDNRFYQALKNGGLNGREFKPETLTGLGDNFDTRLESLKRKKAEPWTEEGLKQFSIEELVTLEKWHLFVSWYALEEFYAWDETKEFKNKWLCKDQYENGLVTARFTGILNSAIKCEELLLWMCEAAGAEQTDSLYKRLISIKERESILKADLNLWISDIKEAIKQKIQSTTEEKQ